MINKGRHQHLGKNGLILTRLLNQRFRKTFLSKRNVFYTNKLLETVVNRIVKIKKRLQFIEGFRKTTVCVYYYLLFNLLLYILKVLVILLTTKLQITLTKKNPKHFTNIREGCFILKSVKIEIA